MARTLVVPMLLALGLGACSLENPDVVVGPGQATVDAGTDLGSAVDVVEMPDRPPPPTDLGFDAGPIDAGVADSGVVDTGIVDTGIVDTGVVDTGVVDTGVVDTGIVDTGIVDTGIVDTGIVDTGVIDTGPMDTGPVDTGRVDSGPVDAGAPDVIVPSDTGVVDVPTAPTCGAENQGCCSPPMMACRGRFSCQPRLFQSSTCRPCGGLWQACCAGLCGAGPCRSGVCTGL